jgi:hypothetical protein
MNTSALSILFAGELATVTLIDASTRSVWVRALPQRHLHHVIAAAEWPHALVELCTYFQAETLDGALAADLPPPAASLPPPAGYVPVPLGWTDNLTDDSVAALHALATKLNFTRAATWAQSQIAAKKAVAPLHEAALSQVMPLVDRVLKPLLDKLERSSNSTSAVPPSSAAPASSSSTSP